MASPTTVHIGRPYHMMHCEASPSVPSGLGAPSVLPAVALSLAGPCPGSRVGRPLIAPGCSRLLRRTGPPHASPPSGGHRAGAA